MGQMLRLLTAGIPGYRMFLVAPCSIPAPEDRGQQASPVPTPQSNRWRRRIFLAEPRARGTVRLSVSANEAAARAGAGSGAALARRSEPPD